MTREVRAVAPVLSGAEEEDLYAGLSGVLMCGNHIGFVHRRDIDVLMRLDLGQSADAIAIDGGGFEIEIVARCLHELGK